MQLTSGLLAVTIDIRVEEQARPVMWMFVGMLVAFLTARAVTRYIRWHGNKHGDDTEAKLRNITLGGVHVHHQVFGIWLMFGAGVVLLAVPLDLVALHITAFVFGVGCGLTFDEYALWFHLEDVYWSQEGRKSIDAIFCVFVITGALIGGTDLLVGKVGTPEWKASVISLVIGLFLSVIALLKGKVVAGVSGIFIQPIALVAAIRLAKPESWWAKTFYKDGSQMEKAKQRFGEAYEARWNRVRDLVAGAPSSH